MIERRQPTHRLVVTLPLDLTGAESFTYDAVEAALRVVIAVSRLAVDGVVCDDLYVALDEVMADAAST